jgi:drug/metabolite transporter (DMT)-like permease
MSPQKDLKSEILSMKSDLLADEYLIIKRKNENFAYIICIFTQFVWAIQGIQLKTYHLWFPNIYRINNFIFWRNIGIVGLGYLMCKYKKIEIKKPNQIKYQLWFYIRNIGIYICIITWMKALSIFRLSSCQIFAGMNPLLTIIMSIFILGDKFYIRYLYGIIICFIGSSIIILNERNPNSTNEINHKGNILIGICSLIINVSLFSLGNIGQKKLCNEKLSPEEQTYYFGVYSLIISFFFCLFSFDFVISEFFYCIYSISNGIVFYLSNYFTSIAFKYIEISKLMPVTYLNVVIIFFLGSFLFNEKIYFSDLIGASMIIGFIVYNGMYPPKSKIVSKNIDHNNIDN